MTDNNSTISYYNTLTQQTRTLEDMKAAGWVELYESEYGDAYEYPAIYDLEYFSHGVLDMSEGSKAADWVVISTDPTQDGNGEGDTQPEAPEAPTLDVDGDGKIGAFSDGVMLIRSMLGATFAGDALTSKTRPDGASRNTGEIHEYIQSMIDPPNVDGALSTLDVDGNGTVDALGDGMMLLRKTFGYAFTDDALTDSVMSQNATRSDIHQYIESLIPSSMSYKEIVENTQTQTLSEPYQKVFSTQSEIIFNPEQVVSIDIDLQYTTSDLNTDTTGLELNIHYNSLIENIEFIPNSAATNSAVKTPFAVKKDLLDEELIKLDKDNTTNKILQIVFLDLGGNFPGFQSGSLGKIRLTVPSTNSEPLSINFSRRISPFGGPVGYDFLGENIRLVAAQPEPTSGDGDGEGQGNAEEQFTRAANKLNKLHYVAGQFVWKDEDGNNVTNETLKKELFNMKGVLFTALAWEQVKKLISLGPVQQ